MRNENAKFGAFLMSQNCSSVCACVFKWRPGVSLLPLTKRTTTLLFIKYITEKNAYYQEHSDPKKKTPVNLLYANNDSYEHLREEKGFLTKLFSWSTTEHSLVSSG